MTIASARAGKAAVIRVAGRMDAVAAPEFERTCSHWIETGIRMVIIDLADLEYISSPGLRAVLAAGEKIRAGGGALWLCAPGGIVKNVLELTGFCSLFPVYDSAEMALEQLP
jgi:anti-anti-sigma factor